MQLLFSIHISLTLSQRLIATIVLTGLFLFGLLITSKDIAKYGKWKTRWFILGDLICFSLMIWAWYDLIFKQL